MGQTVIYNDIWQQVLKREQVSNPFWVVAFVVTKFPKEQLLVHKCYTKMMRNSEQGVYYYKKLEIKNTIAYNKKSPIPRVICLVNKLIY